RTRCICPPCPATAGLPVYRLASSEHTRLRQRGGPVERQTVRMPWSPDQALPAEHPLSSSIPSSRTSALGREPPCAKPSATSAPSPPHTPAQSHTPHPHAS